MSTPYSRDLHDPHVLAVLCVAQFVLILDVAVVNVALVPLARDLATTPGSLQLVPSGYAAAFGGALLLGGRLADSGRRRATFLTGMVLFAAASVLCGVAWSVPALVAGRGAQGLGAALASPAALSLLTATFAEGASRNRALGIWAAVAAGGGAAGLLAGGLLTEYVSWRSVFLINPPVVAAILMAARKVLPPDDTDRKVGEGALPGWSSLAGPVAIVLLVAGLGAISDNGDRGRAVWLLGLAIISLLAFVRLDRRASAPLLPGELLGARSVLVANTVTALMSAVVLGANFFLAVYVQDRLGLGPIGAGLAFLPITAAAAISATLTARLVSRTGARPVLASAMLVMAAGCLLLARLPNDGSYLVDVLPGMLLVGAGMGPGFAVGSIAATQGVRTALQGAAAALLSAATQIGAAIGIALLGIVAAAATAIGPGPGAVTGTRVAFAAMTAAALLAAAVALALPRRGASATQSSTHTTPAGSLVHPPLVPAQAASCLAGCIDRTDAGRPRSAGPGREANTSRTGQG